MNLAISTPAILFLAISLLFLASTNRFLHLAALIRRLHCDAHSGHDPLVLDQLQNLRQRLSLIH